MATTPASTSSSHAIPVDQFEAVRTSYGVCCMATKFFDDFYAEFTSTSPRIRDKFVKTDMTKQKALLRESLTLMIMFANGSSNAENRVNALGKTHCQNKLDIAPDLYPLWLKALIKTVKKHDPKFTPELEKMWVKVMSPGIERMMSMYLAG